MSDNAMICQVSPKTLLSPESELPNISACTSNTQLCIIRTLNIASKIEGIKHAMHIIKTLMCAIHERQRYMHCINGEP